jgi:hypothetical protein
MALQTAEITWLATAVPIVPTRHYGGIDRHRNYLADENV